MDEEIPTNIREQLPYNEHRVQISKYQRKEKHEVKQQLTSSYRYRLLH
jgi:hypothetical protein